MQNAKAKIEQRARIKMQKMINPKHEILKESQKAKIKMQNDKAKLKDERDLEFINLRCAEKERYEVFTF